MKIYSNPRSVYAEESDAAESNPDRTRIGPVQTAFLRDEHSKIKSQHANISAEIFYQL